MADLKVMLDAYYQKQEVRVLEQQLWEFKESLKYCTIPKRREWLKARINELSLVLFERTGTRH